MKKVEEIIIYGSGQRGRGLYTLLKRCGNIIKYVIDTNSKKWNTPFYDTEIVNPDVLLCDRNTPICIAIAREEDVKALRIQLWEKYGVGTEREIEYFALLKSLYQINPDIQRTLAKKITLGSPNIIFECDYGLGLGGIEAWTKEICTELVLNGGRKLHILSDGGEYDIPLMIKDQVVKLPINHDEMFGVETMVSIIQYLLQQLPCVVITGQFYATLFAACLVKQIYPNYIQIISVIHFGKDDLYRQYASMKSYINLFIGVSRDITDGLLKCGIEEEKLDYMTCPVICEKNLAREYTSNYKYPVRLGFAGRVNAKQKRMDLIPEFVKALDRLNVNYYFEIAGQGDYCEKLEKFIRENSLRDKVRLIGKMSREEIGDFWRDKDICISLSDYEGRSISIMEAMANGAIPVVTATSGVREDITDGENGYVVEIQDFETMAEKVCYLEKHRENLRIMGKKAHERIYPKCQMHDHLRYWEKLLDKNLGKIERFCGGR